MIILAEVNVTDGATTTTLRFSSEPYSSGDNYYDPRLSTEDLPLISQKLEFPTERTSGKLQTTAGDITVYNADKELDEYFDDDLYGFDGQTVVLKLVEAGVATTIFTGKIAKAQKAFEKVRFVVKDKSIILDKNIQDERFDGNNALPSGVEGNSDQKGFAKPILRGDRENVPAPLVNQSKLIYQVADDEVDDVTAVRHVGVGFTQETDYSDLTDMYNNEPSPGCYRLLSTTSGSYVRLGSSPIGQPLFDVQEANLTAGDAIKSLLIDKAGFTGSDYSASDFTALNTANSATTGMFTGSQDVFLSTEIGKLAATVGAYYGFDRLGVFRIKRFISPRDETSTLNFRYRPTALAQGEYEALDLEWEDSLRIPTYRVVSYYRQMMDTEKNFAGVVSQNAQDLYGNEWRSVFSENTTVYNPTTRTGLHLNSEQLEFYNDFKLESAAQTECNRLLTLWSARQDVIYFNVDLSIEALDDIDVGLIAKLYADRYGYDNGANVIVTGVDINLSTMTMGISVFGWGTGKAATAGGGTGSGTSDYTPTAAEFNAATNTWYATSDPTVNDDAGDGIQVGHRWINTSTNEGFEVSDTTIGAAVWRQTFTLTDAGDLAYLDTVSRTEIDPNSATLLASASSGSFNPGSGYYTACSKSFTTVGGNLFIMFSGVIEVNGSWPSGTGYSIISHILQDSTELTVDTIWNTQYDTAVTLHPAPVTTFIQAVEVSLSAGTYTFKGEVKAFDATVPYPINPYNVRNCEIIILESRR